MIGFHVSKHFAKSKDYADSIRAAIEMARDHGISLRCAQIFVVGPQNANVNVSHTDRVKLRRIASEIKLFIHSAYVYNVWGPADRVAGVNIELEIADNIGAAGLVIHLGPAANDPGKLSEVLSGLSRGQTPIYFEINATKPSDLSFESATRLRKLFDNMPSCERQIGLCIDTAHLASCGLLLDSWSAAERWLSDVWRPNMLCMFHLNDSKAVPGSGIDRHEALGKGAIWSEDKTGLQCILTFATKHNIPVILERAPDNLAADFKLIRSFSSV